VKRLELPTSWSQTTRATKLRHTPIAGIVRHSQATFK
jgi:hypothetical protein